jgi:hypothetical protein
VPGPPLSPALGFVGFPPNTPHPLTLRPAVQCASLAHSKAEAFAVWVTSVPHVSDPPRARRPVDTLMATIPTRSPAFCHPRAAQRLGTPADNYPAGFPPEPVT